MWLKKFTLSVQKCLSALSNDNLKTHPVSTGCKTLDVSYMAAKYTFCIYFETVKVGNIHSHLSKKMNNLSYKWVRVNFYTTEVKWTDGSENKLAFFSVTERTEDICASPVHSAYCHYCRKPTRWHPSVRSPQLTNSTDIVTYRLSV